MTMFDENGKRIVPKPKDVKKDDEAPDVNDVEKESE